MLLDTPIERHIRTTKSHIDKLHELGVNTVRDFLLFFPRTYEDKREFRKIVEIRTDDINNVKGVVSNIFHKKTKFNKFITKCTFSDETGKVEVVWFNQPYLKRILRNGQKLILSGKAKFQYGKVSLVSPAYEEIKDNLVHTGGIIPTYHQTDGISSKWIREKLAPVIDEWVLLLEDYMPKFILDKYGLIDYRDAVKEVHFPSSEEMMKKAQERLSFDELFLIQLRALQKKWKWQHEYNDNPKVIEFSDDVKEFINGLPFVLTNAQKRAVSEILYDLKQSFPMSRLVQGDVGSGKTVVAGIAIFATIKAGYQTALMAPTEILAKQHYKTLFKLFSGYGFNIQFIAGSTSKSVKDDVLNQLKTGTVDLVIGTHSLIQDGVEFKKLGLAVIDEQHRFGVKQREVLRQNGNPHLLNLSATPIPRTLAMTIYGDQDLSVIDELPSGRVEIITKIVPEKKRRDAYYWVEDKVKKGEQAFVICPLVDESDVLEVKSAIQEYEFLQNEIFPDLKVGLLHGKMKAKEKEEVMHKFKNNEINVLVSTSVIEVGIDVPNATVMLIEGADRFGLSQLHQFRGRVGRGDKQSYCFLFSKNFSENSLKRLKAMTMFSSGFKLAEIDLKLRGPGEIFGVKQSGIPDLKMASLTDSKTIALAREAAQIVINEDPLLNKYEGLSRKVNG